MTREYHFPIRILWRRTHHSSDLLNQNFSVFHNSNWPAGESGKTLRPSLRLECDDKSEQLLGMYFLMFPFAEGGHKGSGAPPFMSPGGHKGTRETSLIIRSTRPRIFMTQIFMEGNFISARKIGRGERSRLFRYPYRKRVLGTPGKIYELSDDTKGKWEIFPRASRVLCYSPL